MNHDGGYTRLYRRLWEHPAFRSKQEAAVFAWMLSTAQWREARVPTKFGPVTLGVGELMIAERQLAEDFGLHRNAFRSLIARMADAGMVELIRDRDRCPYHAGTIVRITKYKEYQCIDSNLDDGQDRSQDQSETNSQSRTDSRTNPGPIKDRSQDQSETDAGTKKSKAQQRVSDCCSDDFDRCRTDEEMAPIGLQDRSRTKNNKEKERNKGKEDSPALPPSKPPRVRADPDAEPEGFVEWYAAYPRKCDPGQARKAYRTALRKTSPAVLLMAARAYADECRRTGRPERYIKNPATWLNAEAWDNLPDVADGDANHGRYPGSPSREPRGAAAAEHLLARLGEDPEDPDHGRGHGRGVHDPGWDLDLSAVPAGVDPPGGE